MASSSACSWFSRGSTRRAVGALQVLIGEPARAAGALGDVLAGELDVHAAEVRAHLGVDAERQLELLEDVLEAARLESAGAWSRCCRASDRTPTAPTGRSGAPPRSAFGSAAATSFAPKRWMKRQPPGLVLRVERRHQSLQPGRVHRRADLDADRDWRCRGSTRRARRRAAAVRMPIHGMWVERLYQRFWRGMKRVCACSYSRCRPSWLA